MSAKVPAWKRLGLKLKSGPETGSPAAEGSKPNGHQQHHDARNANGAADAASSAAAAKRKRPEHSSVPPAFSSPLKRTRTDDHHHAAATTPPTLRKQKSVTFTEDTKNPTAAEATKKKNKSKKPAKPATQQPQADIKPSLEYLRAWKHARATWKFNKNYQSILMKRVFHTEAIPSADIDTFYEYIQDLKGFTRTRLRETADEVRREDAAQGKAAFPQGTPDADSKQSEYEKVLAGLKQLGSSAEESGGNGKRKRFDESGFVAQSSDVAITQRVIKRMRAETILEELAESQDSDAMTIDTEEAAAPEASKAAQEETVDKRVKLNDGTKQSASRRRKQRTANVDSSSDESSDDDSDDDSSSDSDSSDDDSDNESEVQRQAAQRDAEETSSSSSSSSEEEDDDSSDDESSEEEEVTTKKKKKSAGKR